MDEAQLSGPWRAAPADENLRRAFTDPGFDDDGVGADRGARALAIHPGLLGAGRVAALPDDVRRTRRARPHRGRRTRPRSWLVLDGIFYTSDVWLDGTYVGDTEGYFFPHAFEVTEAMNARSEHVLALEVGCAPQTDRTPSAT